MPIHRSSVQIALGLSLVSGSLPAAGEELRRADGTVKGDSYPHISETKSNLASFSLGTNEIAIIRTNALNGATNVTKVPLDKEGKLDWHDPAVRYGLQGDDYHLVLWNTNVAFNLSKEAAGFVDKVHTEIERQKSIAAKYPGSIPRAEGFKRFEDLMLSTGFGSPVSAHEIVRKVQFLKACNAVIQEDNNSMRRKHPFGSIEGAQEIFESHSRRLEPRAKHGGPRILPL